jgi:hypothetical protein
VRIWAVLAIILWLVLAGYTAFVVTAHGLGLLPIFFGDIATLTWPGQFNLDFLFMLIISASWTVWRNGATIQGIGLGLIAFFFGSAFLLAYLPWLIWKHDADPRAVLLGDRNKGNSEL